MTLIVFKPDAVLRNLIEPILSRFTQKGFRIVGMKMVSPDRDFFYHHYETIGKMISRRGEKPFEDTLEYMQQSPVIAVILEGVDVIANVRKMVGATDPAEAAVGTIRYDYAHVPLQYCVQQEIPVCNLLHASGNVEEAELEIEHWFRREEQFLYDRLDRQFFHGWGFKETRKGECYAFSFLYSSNFSIQFLYPNWKAFSRFFLSSSSTPQGTFS